MTVKLLSAWGSQPAGTLYSTDATTEAAMISAKVATSDLTGGVAWVKPGSSPAFDPIIFTSRALNSGDNGATLICATAQTATVPAGLPSGFGCAIKGTVPVSAGPGATVNDIRTTGATNPWCAIVQTATDTYDVVGTKA